MQDKIISSIAEWLYLKTIPVATFEKERVAFVKPFEGFSEKEFCQEIATDLATVISESDWKNAPEWAGWRLDYEDGSHNFSKGYPSITTTGVIRVVKRPTTMENKCPNCYGSGFLIDPIPAPFMGIPSTTTCWKCKGTGKNQ